MSTKKKYTAPAKVAEPIVEEVKEEIAETTVEEIVEDVVEETLKVDTTDETKLVEELVNAKSEDTNPMYHIRTEWTNIATQKASYTDLNRAIRECNKYPGYKVFSEEGNAIHLSTAVRKETGNNAVPYVGKKYDLNEAKLFMTSHITIAKSIVTGSFYLYDAKLINGRYRVVDNKSKIGKGLQFIAGYVAVEEM